MTETESPISAMIQAKRAMSDAALACLKGTADAPQLAAAALEMLARAKSLQVLAEQAHAE